MMGVANALKPKIDEFKPFMTHLMFGLTWRTYVVNVPTGFSAVCKLFLNPVVQRKVWWGTSRVHQTTRRVRRHAFPWLLGDMVVQPKVWWCEASPYDTRRVT